MRKYNILWYVWILWALLIIIWLSWDTLLNNKMNPIMVAIAVFCSLLIIQAIYSIYRKDPMQLFNKSKKNPTEKSGKKTDDAKPPHNDMKEPVKTAPAPPPLAELLESSKPVKAIKDTFVSQGTQLTGTIEGQGNIIVEGVIEGSLTCSHQVRIEPTGHVKGEIHAQHIMINGSVEGSCHADSLTIQPKGHMRGDIFTDEFSIEKGGVFVGQSQLMPQTAAGAGKVTALKTARPAPADAAPQLQEPQQVK
ncbi:hypothetical protein CLM71_17390 [Serratia sp. MYb239]|nr:hypothetical protein CLM71_17390 [Serratia sp. MYb239]